LVLVAVVHTTMVGMPNFKTMLETFHKEDKKAQMLQR
jgi:hypothetical protein